MFICELLGLTKVVEYKLNSENVFEPFVKDEYFYDVIEENGSSTFITTREHGDKTISKYDDTSFLIEKVELRNKKGSFVFFMKVEYSKNEISKLFSMKIYNSDKNGKEHLSNKYQYFYNQSSCQIESIFFRFDQESNQFTKLSDNKLEYYNDSLLLKRTHFETYKGDTSLFEYSLNEFDENGFLNKSGYYSINYESGDRYEITNNYEIINKNTYKERFSRYNAPIAADNYKSYNELKLIDYKLNDDGLFIRTDKVRYYLVIDSSGNADTTFYPKEYTIYTPKKEFKSVSNGNIEKLTIHPNPVQNFLILNDTEPANYRIINLSGQVVFSKKNISEQLNIESLKAGTYFLMKEKNGRYFNQKFIKE